MGRRIGQVGVAVVLAVSLIGLVACGTGRIAPTPVAPTPVPDPHRTQPPSEIVGVWRLTVNGDDQALATFWPDGTTSTTDPAMGMWRPSTAGRGDVEGTWVIPVAGLTVTWLITVDGDQFVGTGLAYDTRHKSGALHPITMLGVRLTLDTASLAQVPAPRVTA